MSALSQLQPDSMLSYLIAFLSPVIDAILPVFPSESAIVALGVATAGSVDPRLVVLIGAAALGACIGDNLCFMLGRYLGPWVDRRFFASDRALRGRTWAQSMLERFGARVIIGCRFIPGGRTVVTFTCGAVEYPWRRFLPLSALSGVIWASYAFVIGRIGGSAFASRPWLGLIVALGLAVIVTLLIEGARRLVSVGKGTLRGRRSHNGSLIDPSPPISGSNKPSGATWRLAVPARGGRPGPYLSDDRPGEVVGSVGP